MPVPLPNQQWTISGRALRPDGAAFSQAGAAVRVSHQPPTGQNMQLGQVPLGADGTYSLSYPVSTTGTIGSASPNLLIQLLDARGAVIASAARRGPQSAEVADLTVTSAALASTFVVSGQVFQAAGRPAANVLVRAFDKDLRRELALGEDRTDRQGRYTIVYVPAQMGATTKIAADLVVRALGADGKALAESPVRFGALTAEAIDLRLPAPAERSEFERVGDALAPLLNGVAPAALSGDDVDFIAGQAGLESSQVGAYAAAHRQAGALQVDPAAAYGLLRIGAAGDDTVQVIRSPQQQRASLQAAMTRKLIPADVAARLDANLAALGKASVKALLDTPSAGRAQPLGKLLTEVVQLSRPAQDDFAQAYLAHEGEAAAFWEGLPARPLLHDKAARLQRVLSLDTVARQHQPMVAAVDAWLEGRKATSLRALVALSADDWLALAKRVGAPEKTPGDTADERATNYARLLAFSVESAFPTAVLADRIGRNTQLGTPDLNRFFGANPDFEFGPEPVANYIRRSPTALAGAADPAKLAAQLGRVERLFKLSPRAEHIQPLLADGLDSAYAIAHLGCEQFVARYAEKFGGAEKAALLFDRARQARDHAQAVGLMLDPRQRSQMVRVMREDPDKEPAPGADLAHLFGSLDFCSCAHCRSLYSPAAYLVDLIQFLHRYGGLEELRKRRRDIFQLELSCENTNTTLPYIDLVNEILEYAVADVAPPQQIASDASAAELRAQPQPLDSAVISTAYSALASALYPIELPFDLWAAEVRLYLDHLGVSRQRLMELFQQEAPHPLPLPVLPIGPAADLPVAQAAEILGLSGPQRAIITGSTNAKPWNLWGIPAPLLVGPVASAWAADLQPVASFLARSGLSYSELEELLTVPYINPIGALTIVAPPEAPLTCDATLLRIDKLDADALVRIRRLLVLRRALGWEIGVLGRTIAAIGDELNDAFLIKLASIERLRAALEQPVDALLSWWAPLDTRDAGDPQHPPLYARLFLNKTLHNPVDPAFAVAAVSDPNSSALLADHADVIQAALRIPASTFALLTDDAISGQTLHRPAELPAGARLSLDALSRLFRTVSFSRALGLSVSELLSLKALSGREPFASPGQTWQFVDLAQYVQSSGFAITELDYLLRDVAAPGFPAALPLREIDLLIDDLRAALEAIAAENALAANPDGALVAEKLTLALEAEDNEQLAAKLKAVMDILDGRSDLSADQQHEALVNHCGHFLPDIEGALRRLVGLGGEAPELATSGERYAFLLAPLMDYLRRTASERAVKQKLGEAFGLELAASNHLLSVALRSQIQPDRPALDDLASVDALAQPAARAALRRMHKAALLISRLRLNADELAWLCQPAGTPLLDLNALPLEPAASGQPAFAAWLRLVDLIRLRNRLPAGRVALLELLRMHASGTDAEGNAVDFLAELSARSGWPLVEVRFLLGAGGWFAASFATMAIDQQLVRLSHCFDVLRRLGVGTASVLSPNASWVAPELSSPARQAVAKAVKDAAKAKHDEERWPAIAAPLRDELRERQRTALVAYLLWKDKLADSDKLFARYLVDVEMGACQLTSRVKQALGSVQTFVQRCLLNLEPTKLSDDAAEEWKWMKVYRVWEANRKVFLYPENWIEPELRDDKSPFFKTLENELLQSDLTKESAEDAYMHYLEKLDQVARLEVMGMYHQVEYPYRHLDQAVINAQPINQQIFEPVTRHDGYRMTTVLSGLSDFALASANVAAGHTLAPQLSHLPPAMQSEIDQSAATMNPNSIHVSPQIQPDVDVLHVIGRSRNTPQVYFYRQQLDGARWTPWEKIDLDIKSNHLIPVVYNRRLYLIWALINEVADEQENLESKAPPTKHLEIQLAWSERKHGRWGPKQETTGYPVVLKATAAENPSIRFYKDSVFFKAAFAANGDLIVQCFGWARYVQGYGVEGVKLGEFPFPGCGGEVKATDLLAYDAQTQSFYDAPSWRRTLLLLPEGTQPIGMRLSQEDYYGWGDPLQSFEMIAGSFNHGDGKAELSNTTKTIFILQQSSEEKLLVPHQYEQFVSQDAFFFEDEQHSFFVVPRQPMRAHLDTKWIRFYAFRPFYHPYIRECIRRLNRGGIDALLRWAPGAALQLSREEYFDNEYDPVEGVVSTPYPVEEVDFSTGGAYASYNWELFFHVPLRIATSLSANQRFEEAQRWFHAIFDPTTGSHEPNPQRFWKLRPFYENKQLSSIEDALEAMTPALEQQIEEWRAHPFNPHLLARMRIIAYQKTVVMKYLDNLIAWGDQLFRRDTIEALNEATQLYLLAADILGPRPRELPRRVEAPAMTYDQLAALELDPFSNAWIPLENLLPSPEWVDATSATHTRHPARHNLPQLGYFCVSPNDILLGYWDRVAERLFKIRNCMNIEGVRRQLPLFEPPIDPMLLVRATAAGIDIGSVLNDLYAPLPLYRFSTMLQKAAELCAELRGLGAALLGALEKRDAEELALLRSSHELALLDAVRLVKEKQIDEARAALEGLKQTKMMVKERYDFYKNIAFMSGWEMGQLVLSHAATALEVGLEAAQNGASTAHNVPDQETGTCGMGPHNTSTTLHGTKQGHSAEAAVKGLRIGASLLREYAGHADVMGKYWRRWDDWRLQERVAEKELAQVDQQIEAARIRMEIAAQELKNHDQQTEQVHAVDETMRAKFTNQELYEWSKGQLAALYFQTYQLAYDVARRAERTFQFERGVSDSGYIKFGYWDSLRQGLLAGERLSLDIKRLELAYLEQNRREYELTRNISLLLTNPLTLIELKERGECTVELPEMLFDMDYPGHYMRRIKSVSLSIPCVTGPYTSVNCTLTLLSSSIRTKPAYATPSGQDPTAHDPNVQTNYSAVQSIATSSAQNDSGLFELNFRDERYLPFESAGAWSQWRIELPARENAFDIDSVSDVIMHLRYTARNGGEPLRDAARKHADEQIAAAQGQQASLQRLIRVRHEFANAWQRFTHPASGAQASLALDLGRDRFPFQFRTRRITIQSAKLYLKPRADAALDPEAPLLRGSTLRMPSGVEAGLVFEPSEQGLPMAKGLSGGEEAPGLWQFDVPATQAEQLADIEELFVLVEYAVR